MIKSYDTQIFCKNTLFGKSNKLKFLYFRENFKLYNILLIINNIF